VLETALSRIGERHWRALLRYATGPDCTVRVFQPTRDVLQLFLERVAARQQQRKDEAAAAAAAAGNAAVPGPAPEAATLPGTGTQPPERPGTQVVEQPPQPAAAAAHASVLTARDQDVGRQQTDAPADAGEGEGDDFVLDFDEED
jgi:hypothetical protein